MKVFVYTEPNECKPKGFFKSIPKAADKMGIHSNSIRNQFSRKGFYTGSKGTLIKLDEL